MPVGVLVVLVLGAIAIDLSVVQLAHRDLLDVAASAANDAATAAVDPVVFRGTGTYELDIDRAYDAVDRTLSHRRPAHPVTRRVVTIDPAAGAVVVELEAQVPYLFARSIPGAAHGTTVTAIATASAQHR